MPHGGYHGTVKIGNNVVQTASQNPNTGQYEISGGIDDSSRLDLNPPQSNQNNQTAAQLEQQIKNQMSGGAGVDGFEGEPIDPREAYIAAQANAQRLNNLMKKEQEEVLRTLMLGDAKAGQLQKENLLGYKGGLFGLNTGPNIGGTTYPPFAYQGFDGTEDFFNQINPITGERIRTVKAREGLSTPDYNKFISELYDANPELYQETFPFASGQIAKPIFARIGEGIMNLPGASEIGQMGGDILNAMISPISGIFSGKKTVTPKIKYDNQGNVIDIISQAPDGGGTKEGFKPSDRKLPYIHSGEIPAEYLDGFTKFYQNYEGPIVGGAAITGVTLPDGSVVEFGDTGSARVFREYLESIGVTPQEEPTEKVEVETPKEEKAPFDLAQFYAGLPTFNQSPYARQGLGSYNEMLRKYFG